MFNAAVAVAFCAGGEAAVRFTVPFAYPLPSLEIVTPDIAWLWIVIPVLEFNPYAENPPYLGVPIANSADPIPASPIDACLLVSK